MVESGTRWVRTDCPSCDGRGYTVADGGTFECKRCIGSGSLERPEIDADKPSAGYEADPKPETPQPAPEPEPAAEVDRTVYYYKLPRCKWCDKFERIDIPKLEALGVKVKHARDRPRQAPAYRFFEDGEEIGSRVGYATAEQVMAIYGD